MWNKLQNTAVLSNNALVREAILFKVKKGNNRLKLKKFKEETILNIDQDLRNQHTFGN